MVQIFSRMVQYFHKHGDKESNIESTKKYSLRALSDFMHIRGDMLNLFAVLEGMGLIQDKSPLEDKKADLLKECLLYMEEHYQEKLYIRDLASLCHLNEQYFTRFFGNHVGVPPAKNTGFHNQGNFIKTFKTIMGESPNQYRKRMQNRE